MLTPEMVVKLKSAIKELEQTRTMCETISISEDSRKCIRNRLHEIGVLVWEVLSEDMADAYLKAEGDAYTLEDFDDT